MKKIDIICDLETLGTSNDSAIIQIAAVACEIESRKIIDWFNVYVDPTKQEFNCSADTIKWWIKTNSELLNDILSKGDRSEKQAIKEFTEWLEKIRFTYGERTVDKKCELLFWGNGILFDNNLIKACCERNGIAYPIKCWNDRDLRTLLYLASKKSNTPEKVLRERAKRDDDKEHDALSDCTYELRLAYDCYQILVG